MRHRNKKCSRPGCKRKAKKLLRRFDGEYLQICLKCLKKIDDAKKKKETEKIDG